MYKPIKRVWVAPPLAGAGPVAPVAPAAAVPVAGKQVFGELPETEVEEKDSDSIWAAFESVYARASANKD